MRPALALLFGLCLIAPARAEPANTLNQLFNNLNRCLIQHGLSLHSGSAMTLRFSLKRDGSLNGKPRVTYAKLPADEADRQRDVAVISDAFGQCLPLSITDALGGAIAGQPLSVLMKTKAADQGA